MDDRKTLILQHINERLTSLKELGKVYSPEKIDELATKLSNSPKTLTEIYTLIDNKFSNQVRKINHNKYLASLQEYYIASIDKLKKNNNCYLLSYEHGIKVLEQANIKELKDINPYIKKVSINNEKIGYQKENSVNNDYELIMSDIAYLLKIEYANTYRIFDKDMKPKGVVNISFETKNEKFLNLEETLQFIKEESTKFNLTQELIDYHDKRIKKGLEQIIDKKEYENNLEYVFKLFRALPDITEDNIKELKKAYLNIKIFEILTNSLNNNLSNIGLIVNKENLKYTYKLSPSYNKYTIEIPSIEPNETICNFYIVDKKTLLETIINKYYNDVKEILTLIVGNRETLFPLINQVIKEHLEYDEYKKYYNLVSENLNMIEQTVTTKKATHPDTDEDKKIYEKNNELYQNRISPFVDNYVSDYDEEKGSIVVTAIIVAVLLVTVAVILLAILSISKMDM